MRISSAWLETVGCAVTPVHIAASGTGHNFTTGHDGVSATSGIHGASNGHSGQGNDEFTHDESPIFSSRFWHFGGKPPQSVPLWYLAPSYALPSWLQILFGARCAHAWRGLQRTVMGFMVYSCLHPFRTLLRLDRL